MDNNYQAHMDFNKLIALFKDAKEGKSNLYSERSTVPILTNRYNDEVYPENYGGAYYDPKTEKLNICLTSKTENNQLEGLIDSDIMQFCEVKYSLTELLNYMETVYDVMQKYHIDETSLCQEKQMITIHGAKDFDKDGFVNYLKEMNIQLDCVYFSDEIVETVNTTETIPAGDIVRLKQSAISSDYGTATVGCNGYQLVNGTKKYGIITAGHLYNPSYKYYSGSNTYICTTAQITRYYQKNKDAAFLPFQDQSNFNQTSKYINRSNANEVIGDFTTLCYPASALIGTSAVKYGIISGKQTGTITSVNKSFHVGLVYFKDFIEMSITQMPGDSGCPVGIETGTAPNKTMSLLGIATQANSSFSVADCCKAINIHGAVAFIEY